MSKQKMGSSLPEVQPAMGLETLLSLDGEIFPMDCGYWTKLEAKQVVPTEHIPHGIKYCLTLHDQHNNYYVEAILQVLKGK
jgi:hypothetical protein